MLLDISYKIAVVIIAVSNLSFQIWLYFKKDKKDDFEKEKDRKFQLLKTLVLDHRLKKFYELFDILENKIAEIKGSNTLKTKKRIETALQETFIKFRTAFYDSLFAIDETLHTSIKSELDELQSDLILALFSEELNLRLDEIYQKEIFEKINVRKSNVIGKLYSYRG